MDETAQKSVFHSFAQTTSQSPLIIGIVVAVVALGMGTGYFFAGHSAGGPSNASKNGQVLSAQKGAVYGSDDTATFKDTTQGKLTTGGINGEGQFHLIRPGGDSQNVYMTSSQVDLSLFVGRTVKVWGQTQKAKTAGWLMDVGRVEVLD